VSLIDNFDRLLQSWRPVFSQQRTFERAYRLTFGLLACLRTHLTSTAICAVGRQFLDWSADYRLFSRSPWNPHDLFDPILDQAIPLLPTSPAPIMVAIDDTACQKTGRKIPGVITLRDPQSPPYHVNLIPGLRFVQASLLVSPLQNPGPARALPIRFEPAPLPPKPKKKASPEEWKKYRDKKKTMRLTKVGTDVLTSIRDALDKRSETKDRQLLTSVDGSYTNRPFLRSLPPNTIVIGRIRKDANLHYPLPDQTQSKGRHRRYGPAAPTPQEILSDESVPTQEITCFAAGKLQHVKIKTIVPIYWKKTGADKPLRLVIIKPLGYRLRNGSKLLYREPAFLICTDPDLDLKTLVQAYVYRWEIECNHRDEKSFIGVAQGQVRNSQAVTRLPQFQVAGYSLLLLASLLGYGFQRTDAYLPLPKWRRKSIRPSILDILNLLRSQIFALACHHQSADTLDHFVSTNPQTTNPLKIPITPYTLAKEAA
jgi:hypothetical protein